MISEPLTLPTELRVSVPSRFTPEQADVLRRLNEYPHDFFALSNALPINGGCFVCVAGHLCNGTADGFLSESRHLRSLCGPSGGKAWRTMQNLIGANYGRDVPGVQDYPVSRVPKAAAIQAVRDIFLMANSDPAISLARGERITAL